MGSGSLNRELDLNEFVSDLSSKVGRSIEINFVSDGMVTLRLDENSPAYILYRTGTFQIRGAENEERLDQAVERFRDLLADLAVEVPNYEFHHITSVFMEDLYIHINLELLYVDLGMENTEYEPEQFPALIYRPPQSGVTLLVFASGKVILSGTADRNEAKSAVQHLRERLDVLSD